MRLKLKWGLLIGAEIVIAVISIFGDNTLLVTLSLIVWIDLVLYALSDLKKHSFLLFFLFSFFVFLLGKECLERYGLYDIEFYFSDKINAKAEGLILLSLVSLFLGYYLNQRVVIKWRNKAVPARLPDDTRLLSIRLASKYVLLLFYTFRIVSVLETAIFVIRNGYGALYTSYESNIPFVIQKLGTTSTIAFFVYLSTFPSKKERRPYIVLYLISSVLTLGTGLRFEFVASLFALLVFIFTESAMDQRSRNTERKWYLKWIVYGAIGIPVLMVGMRAVASIRSGQDVSITSIWKSCGDFIYGQGASVNLLKWMQVYESKLKNSQLYTLYSLKSSLTGNEIAQLLGSSAYENNTAALALQGNSLSSRIGFYYFRTTYLGGSGVGSCYIAESYVDFSYFGVVFVNMLYGVLLSVFGKLFVNKGIWTRAICLYIYQPLLRAPRGATDGVFAGLINLTLWLSLLIIYFVTNFLDRRRKAELTG